MVSKITAIIESVPIWGDDNFDANVHENFLKLKELGPQLNKTVDEINKTFEDIDTYTKTATTKAGEAVQSASTANNAKQTATTQAEIATTKAGEAAQSANSANSAKQAAIQQAEIASTKAGEAAQSANSANSAKQAAIQQAEIATNKAGEVNDIKEEILETILALQGDPLTILASAELAKKANKTDVYTKDQLDLKISTQQFDKPSKGPLFVKVSPSSIKIPAGLKITVGTESFKTVSDYTLTLSSNLVGSSKIAGTDYYVYAKSDATFYISANDAITTDRLIGGFHYGLVPTNEAPTGNKTEADMILLRGINAYSFWDLKFLPKNGVPEAKAFKNGLWGDIYRGDTDYAIRGYSKANTVIATGATTYGRGLPKIPTLFGGDGTTTYGKLSWFETTDIAIATGMRLPTYEEFQTFAYGVVEKTAIGTVVEKQQGRTQHYAELMSKVGIEQATGEQYCWSKNLIATEGTFAWNDNANGRGQIYSAGTPKAVIFGGARGDAASSGSSCSNWSHPLWGSYWDVGFWFLVDHLELD